MDAAEVEENLFAASDAKLHSGMCRQLSAILYKVLAIFPVLEGAKPRSKSGIQALCSLHVALDKSKNLLKHCSECSKLYLAMTGDSIRMKFEKTKCALQESLKGVQDIVPQSISSQIMEIVSELEKIVFTLDPVEKQVGDEVISLIHRENNVDDGVELKAFHEAVLKLGIASSPAALTERRALKKLIERGLAEEDKRKQSVASYLLHLTRNHSKLFRREDDSNPNSPTLPGEMLIPPEEFRCPISSQIMHDPVIISSGHTYERICVEQWFKDGNDTCPKTREKLAHLSWTPNLFVKDLIASWCQKNGYPVPDGPIGDDPCAIDDDCRPASEDDEFERYESLFEALRNGEDGRRKREVVETIRALLKENEAARVYLGASRFVEALVGFLSSATKEDDEKAQEVAALALFNLALNNDRSKDMMLSAGVIPLMEKMILNPVTVESATALYLNLSILDRAKPAIGSSPAVPVLVQLLSPESSHSISCKQDALLCLFNLSSCALSVNYLIKAGIIDVLHSLLSNPVTPAAGSTVLEKALAVLAKMASWEPASNEMISTRGLVSSIAAALIAGHPPVQEQALSCLLILCEGDDKCCRAVLQQGVIPTLVSISASGTQRNQEKAKKLLKIFRERRHRDPSPARVCCNAGHGEKAQQSSRALGKSRSVRIVRTWSSFWKTRHRW